MRELAVKVPVVRIKKGSTPVPIGVTAGGVQGVEALVSRQF